MKTRITLIIDGPQSYAADVVNALSPVITALPNVAFGGFSTFKTEQDRAMERKPTIREQRLLSRNTDRSMRLA